MKLYELTERRIDPKTALIDAALAAMHRRATSKGDLQSIGGYAFDISRSFNTGLSAKQLEKLYRERYNTKDTTTLYRENKKR